MNKIRISDIADLAGVSIATVSRVLNNRDKVRESTRKEVYSAMRKLNYQLPEGENALTMRNILMLVPNIGNPFYALILDGAEEIATAHGYNILLMQASHKNHFFDDNEYFLQNISSFAGLLLLQPVSPKLLARYDQMRIPYVQCSEYNEDYDVSYVGINDELAAKNATEYLLSLGRKKIAFLNSMLTYQYARHREAGFIAALQHEGVEINTDWIFHFPDVAFDIAFPSTLQMLQQPEIPDAIFAISDVFAAAAIKAAIRLGLQIPKDIAVVGFDNVDVSNIVEPSITTIDQPRYQLGALACNMLIDRIENPGMRHQKLVLDTHLIVRESSML